MNIEQELMRAIQLHQSGQLVEAAEIYRDIIKADPTSVDAWNLLCALFVSTGEYEAAVAAGSQAVALQPDFFVAYVNLGNALQAMERLDDALAAFTKAVELSPDSPEAQNNLASALNAQGRHEEALAACETALRHEPNFVEAYNNRGNAEAGLGRPEAAIASYRKVLAGQPDHSDALYNLGGALMETGNVEEAITCYRSAVLTDPDRPEKHFNLGNALQAAGRMEEAETSHRNALQLSPEYTDALNNLGSVVQALGRLDEAEDCFRQALAQEPDSADVHWNLALVLLQKGDYEEGWREYEWRWKNPDFTSPKRDFDRPEWGGDELGGKTILLHAEQGFGDTIQFARFAPLVADRGGKVVLECRRLLASLLETLPGVETVVAAGETLPDFDCHLPLMSLPRVFGTTVETVPRDLPYIGVPEGRAADPRIAGAEGVKVGLVWSGSATRRDNLMRSVTPQRYSALFDLPDTQFFSLQVGADGRDLEPFAADDTLIDLGSGLETFADTAAAIAALDLVVTVDTAAAHLAGALDKPVWVLLAFAPGYLWMLEREDSPWYPSARLFRQPAWGDWNTVFVDLKAALRDFCRENGS